nr:uncharacterized protein LOC103416051 isoform X2 [Malus domestica]
MSIFRHPHNLPLWNPFRVYPLNFLCSPPALNEHLGLCRSSASSLSQKSLRLLSHVVILGWMLWPANGWSWSHAISDLSSRGSTVAAGHS